MDDALPNRVTSQRKVTGVEFEARRHAEVWSVWPQDAGSTRGPRLAIPKSSVSPPHGRFSYDRMLGAASSA